MSHFYGRMQGIGSRLVTKAGGKSSGLHCYINGWNKGIRVEASFENGRDCFKVFSTGGSNNSSNERLVQTVKEKKTRRKNE